MRSQRLARLIVRSCDGISAPTIRALLEHRRIRRVARHAVFILTLVRLSAVPSSPQPPQEPPASDNRQQIPPPAIHAAASLRRLSSRSTNPERLRAELGKEQQKKDAQLSDRHGTKGFAASVQLIDICLRQVTGNGLRLHYVGWEQVALAFCADPGPSSRSQHR